jgi:hypothetical protein
LSDAALKIFAVCLGALQAVSAVLFLATKQKQSVIANALQPALVLAAATHALVRSQTSDDPRAWTTVIAFFAFEVFLLGLSINWIWRGLPRARFFWAYWIANLLPLILLGYLAFIFHVF